MKNPIKIFSSLFLVFLFTTCNNDVKNEDVQIEENENVEQTENVGPTEIDKNCLVTKIDYVGFIKYEYFRNNEGLFKIEEYGSTKHSYYVDNIASDSITIGEILSDLSHENPFIIAKYENKRIKYLERIYLGSNANIFGFQYDIDKIRVTQEYRTGSRQYIIAYGDYFLNQDGNITSVKKYKRGGTDGTTFILFDEKYFTYDMANNPWKGIVYPNFTYQALPCSKFFSSNNVVTVTKDSLTERLEYLYDNDVTIKRFQQFNTNACGITKYNEIYTYSNCPN